jgi:ascorbate PTS system EIIA or EIIAB component
MLEEYIEQNGLLLQQFCCGWEDAIEKGAAPLLAANSIDRKYIEAIKKNHKEIGPYMVIAPGIMLSHARPECGAKKLGLTIMTLSKPIVFGHTLNDPVNLIFTLATPDENSHLKMLEDLMGFMMKADFLAELQSVKTPVEALAIIKRSEEK